MDKNQFIYLNRLNGWIGYVNLINKNTFYFPLKKIAFCRNHESALTTLKYNKYYPKRPIKINGRAHMLDGNRVANSYHTVQGHTQIELKIATVVTTMSSTQPNRIQHYLNYSIQHMFSCFYCERRRQRGKKRVLFLVISNNIRD